MEASPLLPFAGGGDTLAHYPYRGRCGVGKYYIRNLHDTLFYDRPTADMQRQH